MDHRSVTPSVCATEPPWNPHLNSIRVRVPDSSFPDVLANLIKIVGGTSLNLGREVADGENRGIKLMNFKNDPANWSTYRKRVMSGDG